MDYILDLATSLMVSESVLFLPCVGGAWQKANGRFVKNIFTFLHLSPQTYAQASESPWTHTTLFIEHYFLWYPILQLRIARLGYTAFPVQWIFLEVGRSGISRNANCYPFLLPIRWFDLLPAIFSMYFSQWQFASIFQGMNKWATIPIHPAMAFFPTWLFSCISFLFLLSFLFFVLWSPFGMGSLFQLFWYVNIWEKWSST